jgi:hypothetical protein
MLESTTPETSLALNRNYSGRKAEGFEGFQELGFLRNENLSLFEPKVVETE